MVKFVTGDMMQAETEALVNAVNTVGVMGKGIALQFKTLFPYNYCMYNEACKKGDLIIGELLAVDDESPLYGKRLIVNFPTKQHWKQSSKYEYIEKGLIALHMLIEDRKIQSIALPALGCGNGGLDWMIVKPMIQKYLNECVAEIVVFEPMKP